MESGVERVVRDWQEGTLSRGEFFTALLHLVVAAADVEALLGLLPVDIRDGLRADFREVDAGAFFVTGNVRREYPRVAMKAVLEWQQSGRKQGEMAKQSVWIAITADGKRHRLTLKQTASGDWSVFEYHLAGLRQTPTEAEALSNAFGFVSSRENPVLEAFREGELSRAELTAENAALMRQALRDHMP